MDSVQFARVLVWLNHFVIATELVTTRAMPDRDVFYVAHPIRSIVSRLLPQRSTATSRLYRPCRSSCSLHCGMRTDSRSPSRSIASIISGLYLGIGLFVIKQGRV